MPIRIQRSRARGSKTPPNTQYCGRPGPWGNPYPVSDPECLEKFEKYSREKLAANPDWLHHLVGKDYLSCWCSTAAKCHVDILIKLIAERYSIRVISEG